jgi:hypothetical protein
MAGFRNNFLNHRRLSEQLPESRNKNPEEGNWKDFLQVVSVSKKHAETLFWIFLKKRQQKN